jgi:hypothetical protein
VPVGHERRVGVPRFATRQLRHCPGRGASVSCAQMRCRSWMRRRRASRHALVGCIGRVSRAAGRTRRRGWTRCRSWTTKVRMRRRGAVRPGGTGGRHWRAVPCGLCRVGCGRRRRVPLRSSAVAWHTALKDTLREWLRRLGVDALEEVGVGAPKLWKRRRTERTRRCVQHVRTRRAVRHADGAERGAEHDSVGTEGGANGRGASGRDKKGSKSDQVIR